MNTLKTGILPILYILSFILIVISARLKKWTNSVFILLALVFGLSMSFAAQADPVWQTGTGNQTSNSGTSGNTQTVSKPANIQAGDLIIVTLHYERTNLTLNSSDGFTLIRRETYTTSTADGTASRATVAAFYKIATASEPATYTFTSSGNLTSPANWRIMANRVTGHNPIQPIGNQSGNNAGTSTTGTSRAITGINITSHNALLVSAMSMASGNISALNVPTGMTQAFSSITRTAAGVAYQTIATPGATGNKTWSWTTGRNNAGLLFAINNNLDYGDAPDTATGTASGNYQTLATDNGPRHAIIPNLMIGSQVDADNGTLQNSTATSDDTTNSPDDEDGLVNPPIMPTTAGQTYSLPVYVKNETNIKSYLTAYIDFNRDGDFVDAGEKADTQYVYWNGYFYPTFTLPSGLTAGTLHTRLRLSQTLSEADVPTGAATSGEVEDHTLTVSSGTLYDFGDAPASYGNARHTINNSIHLGINRPDAEAASQYSYNARFGDGADEDGVPSQSGNTSIPLFPILKMTASSYSVDLNVTNTTASPANLRGWIDFDQNGLFDTDEAATVSVPTSTSNGTATLTWNSIPTDIKLGTTFIRLRLTTDATVTASTPSNNASNGEVEDYPIAVAIDVPPDSTDVTIVKGETPACSSTVFTDNFNDVPADQYFGANTSATPYVIRDWTATGGGSDSYARTLTTALFPTQGTSIYFGNGFIRRFYPDVGIAPQFDGNGRMLSPPDAIELRDNVDDTTPGINTNQADWGPEPVKLSRTFATTAGQRYRLYFSAIPEDAGNDYYASGLMRVDTPSGSVHFKAPGGMEGIQKYRIEFTATGTSSTISFINYGHLGTDGGYCDPNSVISGPWCSVGGIPIDKKGNELIIDDVTVALASACPTSAIAGTVYTDKNGNDAFDSATESGLGNISVSLYDNNGTTTTTTDDLKVATVATAANGSYSFANISAVPRYRIEVDTRDTDLPTSAVIGTTNPLADVAVTAGNTLANQNFGFDLGCDASAGEFGGIVFRDYNQNGIRESQEEGIAGVTVTAYDTANTAVATTATDARGWYRFSGQTNGAQYRLEFTGLPASLSSGAQGTDSATNVRFVTASNSCSTHYGVSDPVEYCQATPYVAANVFVGGDPTAADVGVYTSVHTFPYNATGPAYAETPPASSKASIAQTGAIWGMAYQKSSKTLYASAVMRRFSGLGSLGTGGIYKINMNDPTTNTGASAYLDVKTIGIDTGADVRLTDSCSPKLSTNPWVAAHDVAAWDAVGKVGIGDIDHDDANNRLWLVNLNDRKLYGINNISPTTTPTAANVLGGYSINLPSPHSCTSGTFRPWAVKYHRGYVYVGGVCDASSAPYTLSNVRGYVLRFDPANTAAGFSYVKDFPIDQQRNLYSHDYPAQWNGWIPQADAVGWPYFHSPIVSNLEFDTDGSIIIGIADRAGMQNGNNSYDEPSCADLGVDYTSSTGDVLRLCKTDSGYATDSEPGCTTDIPSNSKTINEYYWGDMGPTDNSWQGMNEIASGGLAMAPGSATVLMSSYDVNTWGTNGVAWLNNRTGSADNRYYVSATTMGKATGMGELEILCDQAPNEIGNKVWLDTDKDGIQDAGEAGINNVNVTLTCGTDSASTTTNTSGEYYFSNVSGGNATFMGSGESCSLSISSSQASLSGHTLTTQNADSKTDNNYQTDIRDSDAAVSGANAVISFTVGSAGQNNHSLDFGYQTNTSMGSISGTVYRDSNQNNSFDSGSESGIASISVSLYDENFTASNTADDTLLSTVSSGADGSYSFSNLNPARSYRIQTDSTDSDLPAGASIGTANPLTGVSVAAGATTGNQNFGFDLPSSGSCAAPAPSGTNAYINTAVGWTHDENDPAGQAANHALPAINKPDEIAAASNQTAAGLTTGRIDWGLYATTASVPATLADAISNNKYLQYSFTTQSSLSNTHILYGLGLVTQGTTIGSNHSGKYKIQVQVDDNAAFSSPQVVKTLIQIDEANPTTGASISEGPYDYGVAYYYNHYDFDSPLELASNTTYYVRFYLYDDTVSGFFGGSANRVVFDNLKLKTHECATSTSNDFGDAPATYGDASHTIVAGIHLGDNAPDGETASKYSFNARTDNHDDGAPSQNAPGAYIPLFPVLQLTDTSYSSSFKVTNNTGTAGKLYGWIDFDKSGTFEEDEAASVDVPTGSSNASVTLNWANIPFDVQLGTTAIRLRLTTDSSITTSTPTGAASNGEVEDYPIAIAMDIPPNSSSLAIISGATPAACETVVFQDNFDDLTPTVFWGTNRPGSQAIRDWTRSGGGNDTYAHITTPVGQGSSVYFGNGGIRQISPATPSGYTFDANGKLLTTIDAIALRDDMDDFITPGTTANEYGSKADWGPEPVRLARTFATTPGKTYRLYFKAIPENPAGTYASGIMRLDMPGGSIHFKAPGSAEGTQTYAVEFTAFDYNSTITFVNYGHTEGSNNGYCDPNSVFNANPWCTVGGRDDVKVGNELIIDDVVLTQAACATGTIHGTVYHDANLNNSHDAGIETGITAISVKLYDENGTTGNTADDRLVYTASTYVQGGYYFTDVDTSNTYRIEVDTADPDLPAHMLLGTANPLTGVTVTANTILYNQDFGFDLLTPSNIAGTVYLDNNTNDVFDTGVDYGLGSIKVSLYNDNGTAGNTADDTLLGNTSTAINGAYRFDNLDHTLTYRVAVDTTDTDIPAGATIGTTNPFTGVAVPANTTVTKNFGFDQASNGITGKVFLDYNLNGQLDSNSAMSNFANNTSIKLAFDKGIAGAQIKAECVGASGKLSFGPVTSDVNGQYYLATPGAVAGNYNCVLQMSSIPAGYSVATQSGSGNQVLTQVVSPTAVNTYFALQEETSYCQNNPDMATNRFAYGQQTPNPPFAGNNDVPNIFAFPYNSGTTGLPNTNPPGYNQPLETDAAFRDLALANQVGSVFGLGWHPASDSLFASAYMKAWTGFGSGGTGGIYRVDMSNPASPTTSLYANLNQIFPATPPTAGADPYLTGVFSAGNPGYVQIADGSGSDPDGSYVASGNATRDNQDGQINDAVGKTAFGDLDVSADGKSLFAVNMANNKLYILPIRAAPLSAADAGLISSYNIPFASNCKTGGTKHTFGLGEYQGGLYVATQCGAEYGLPWEVPEHSVFRFDLGSKTFSTTPSLVYSRPSEDTYSINFSTITDLVFDPAGNMTLTFRETLPSPYGPSVDGGKGTGYSVIRRACVLNKATFTWERENNGSCGGVTTAGKDNGYGTGPSYGTFFHQEYPADHGPSLRSASYGGAAQIPGFMEAAYTIAEPFEFYSVGISWVDTGLGNPATAGQRNRAYSFYKGTGAFEYPDNRPVNGKNAAIGDLEILCDTPSLEIGNRVWQDSDSDGVQDAGEPPVAGIKVELFANGANLASATPLATALTDANGYYAFSSDMRGYPATGNNAPNDTTGANGGFNAADIQGGRASTASHKYGLLSLTPNTQYQVVIRNVGGASKQAALGSMTLSTAAQGTDPELDSDAGAVGDHAVANVSMLGYGNHYHAVDFGFKAPIASCDGRSYGIYFNAANNYSAIYEMTDVGTTNGSLSTTLLKSNAFPFKSISLAKSLDNKLYSVHSNALTSGQTAPLYVYNPSTPTVQATNTGISLPYPGKNLWWISGGLDPAGNLYFMLKDGSYLVKINLATSQVTTIWSTWPATTTKAPGGENFGQLSVNVPSSYTLFYDITFDSNGDALITDADGHYVWKVTNINSSPTAAYLGSLNGMTSISDPQWINDGGTIRLFGSDANTPDGTHYIDIATWNTTKIGTTSFYDMASCDFSILTPPASNNSISGKVFEDVNYGGGAGRPLSTAGAAGVLGVRVELYNSTGNFVTSTTTADGGPYSFANLANGTYYVRVVNDTIRSTRAGSDASERSIQTFRSDGTSAVTNEVGGRKPALVDAAANTTNQTLNTSTFVLSGGGQAQSVQPVTVSGSNITGADFGFNFSTVININDSGQGSLRQGILNINLLANTGLAQAGQDNTYGINTGVIKEVLLFNIPAASDPLGRTDICGGSTCKITINTQLPAVAKQPAIIDATTQPGYVAGTPGIPRIQIVPTAGLDARGFTMGYDAPDSTLRGVAITGFRHLDSNRGLTVEGENTLIESNYIGVKPDGTADGNSNGIELQYTQSAVIGGTTAAKRNIISGNSRLGIFFNTGASGSTIQNNFIGTNPAGTAAMGNGTTGIDTESGSGTKILNNIIAGNPYQGIELGFTSGGPGTANAIIQGNRIGVGINGEAIGNGTGIINYGVSNGHTIGGTGAGQANIIAHNLSGGISFYNNNSSGITISANSIYANGGLGIDLGFNSITVNDANDADAGANNLLNFPLIADLSIASGNLTIKGCAPSGATVELFEADVSTGGKATPGDNKFGKSKDYGEGQTYLASFVEGSGSDTDAANCTLATDADGNNQTGMKAFSVTIPAPATFVAGDTMTATATLAGTGTSEFSPVFLYDATCKLIVTTTADTDSAANNSGSLRDAIECANSTPGVDSITFNMPNTETGFINPDGVANNGNEYWRISLNSQLPSITEGVSIDGRTQTSNKGNTNSGNVAAAATVGTDNIALAVVTAPEIEIVGQWFGAGFDIKASNVSIYGLGMRLFDTDIRMDQANTTGILLNELALGVNPVNGGDPGAGQRSNQHIAVNASGVGFVLTSSLLGFNDNKRGIVTGQYNNVSDVSATISGNHFIGVGMTGNTENAAIEILRTQNPSVTISGNRFVGRGSATATDLAVEFNDYGGGNTTCVTCRVENNTISGFHDGVGYFTDASLTGLVVSKNRIYSNTEFAVFLGNVQNASVTQNYLHDNGKSGVLINKDPAKGNVISQNSIYHNGEVGINLAGGNQVDPGGVTLNDANDADNGPNGLLNMPVINQVIVGASNLTVRGCAPAAAVVELFEADVSPGGAAAAGDNTFALSRDYGEGQRYLTSVAENSAADIDAGNCALPAFDGMNNTGMKAFQFTLPLPSGIVVGDKLTATATVAASGTSEFGPVITSEGSPPNIGGGSCTASGGTDILFIVNNSGSITPEEYADFASTIQTVGTQLLTDNPQHRIGIAHFGGPTDSLVSGGQYVYFERDFSSVAMTAPVRQFGTGGAYNVNWWADHLAGAVQQIRYALDGNASTSSTYIVSPVREMSRNASTPLQIVLMTDAVRYGDWVPSDISMLIDPAGSGAEPDDGSDFTIYNQLKSAGISFSVVSFNPTPADIAASAAIASTGGTYNGSIDANPQDPQGSQTTPRRFISVTSGFQLTAAQVNELVEGTAICTSSISGLVFEDPNYGGLRDAGGVLIPRPASSAGTKGIANATVEIYASNGSFVDSTSTDTNGIYKLPSLTDGKYYVRVVSDSVSSSRAGGNGSELPVQTYPTVGGVKPSVADAGINAGGASSLTVSPSKTFVFTSGTLAGQQAQSVQEITLSGSSINNVDFGFNFSSVVNTNDNGQGSLRQFLLNANLLGDDNALTQEGRSLSKEHAILILPTSDPRYASGVWTVLLNTSLPNIDKPMILDGSTQSGFNPATGVPVVKLDGNNLAGNGLSLVAGSTGSSIRSLAITRFGGDGINLQGNTTGNAILGNSIHTNGGLGIDLVGGTENVHGVTANASNDTGPNNLLNYPEFKIMGITDSTKIITYDFDLDVPVGTYRLEFFKNDSADASGHGEGQIYLGGRDIEVSATGKQNYKGSFNANQLLAGNDKVSATLTRKVGADFTDTSEFAGTATGTTTTVCKDWITNPSLAPADFNIAENSSIVAFITAKDASGNTINYALKGADGKYFAITASSPTTPECKTVKMIDPNVIITKSASADGEAGVRAVPPGYLPPPGNFESPADANKDNVYEVQVVATYTDGTQVTRDLTVRVLNENEAPVIISAPAVSFVEDSVANVLDIASQDQDAGTSEGNGLSYRISGGTDASFFAVTSTAGILTFRAIPDYDAPMDSNRDNIYEVEVTVTDTGGLSNSKLFTVTVTNNTADDGILLQTRAFLQGAYDGGSQMMAADLNALGLLPAKQPYGLAPFKYTGTETLSDMLKETTGNNAPVDWMLVELRSSLSQVVASRAVIVQRDGDLVDAQTGSPDLHFAKVAAGNYYVVIRHRNHLDVITASPVSLVNTARMVDFTLSATAVKAEHARVTAGKLALMWAGDINGSQTLTASGPGNDANTLLSTILSAEENPQAHTNYVLHGYLPTDINMDGKTLFSGPNNDASLLVGNILLHPLNTGYASNYIVKGGLSP
ncbi:MAG: right-handed parallel beta-helix repeat-containing protein [Candidatus Thiothrix moscowensis]|nr:right-handed parallel beta-helix repeat-containing protein [Candidatus Thiothrix moscowensis]